MNWSTRNRVPHIGVCQRHSRVHYHGQVLNIGEDCRELMVEPLQSASAVAGFLPQARLEGDGFDLQEGFA